MKHKTSNMSCRTFLLFVTEVILVDGHSSHDTVAIAQQLLSTIRLIKQAAKGQGDALRQGFAAYSGDIIVMLDADGLADPCEIPKFVEALVNGNDFAKGSCSVQEEGFTNAYKR